MSALYKPVYKEKTIDLILSSNNLRLFMPTFFPDFNLIAYLRPGDSEQNLVVVVSFKPT